LTGSEPAVSAAAHHQEIGIVGGVEQYLRGTALDGAGAHRKALPGPTALLIASARGFSAFSLKWRSSSVPADAHP
jgi:hypothetical protein